MPEPTSTNKAEGGKRLWRWLAEALLLLLLIYLVHLWQTRDALKGSPSFIDEPLLEGGRFSFEQRGEEPLLVYFWATWCPVCSLTSETVSALAEEHAVLTVAMQSGEAEAVRQHMHQEGLSYPVILDPRAELARDWGVRGVPAFFVLDAENRVRYVSVGYTTHIGLLTRLWLSGK